MESKNDGMKTFINVLIVIFSVMSLIGTIGLFSYFGNTTELENQTVAYAGVCIAGSIGLAILLLINCFSNFKN